MLSCEKIDINGWIVTLSFNEFKLDQRSLILQKGCAVWATAELRDPVEFPPGWKQTALLRYPQGRFVAIFDCAPEGRAAAVAALTAQIRTFEEEAPQSLSDDS